ncbi:MAG TPA: M23 family metallopeptidase, partial [Actinobacteria bacterium]|nr:M23 family metallopeptidase [Actinomycetota bacterium]
MRAMHRSAVSTVVVRNPASSPFRSPVPTRTVDLAVAREGAEGCSMLRTLLVGVILVSAIVPDASCGGAIVPPVGQVVRAFAPVGSYAGHWGVDVAMERGSTVRAVADGVVTFASAVAGVRTVTIFHGGSLRTSYSYLDSITVATGDRLLAGDALGKSG